MEVQEGTWFTMNHEQQRKHIARVHSAVVSDASGGSAQLALPTCHLISPPASSQREQATTGWPVLSIDLDSAAQFVSVPFKCLEGI